MADDRLHILHVGLTDQRGGMESFAIEFGKQLKKKDIIFDYTCMYKSIASADEIDGQVYFIPKETRDPMGYYRALSRVAVGYKIAHVNMLSCANILTLLALRKAGVQRVIMHSHNTSSNTRLKRTMHRINKPFACRYATDYLACSREAAEWLFPKKMQDRVTVLKNAIDFDRMKFDPEAREQIRREIGADDDELVIGNFGRHTYQKNVGFLIRVFKGVLEKGVKAKLLLVGNGDEHEALAETCRKTLEPGKALIMENQPDINRYYSAIDIFCMPSLFEGLSISAIEAQASGLDCLFSDRVTEKTRVLPETQFLPLKEEAWVGAIVNHKARDREPAHVYEFMKKSGFLIEDEAGVLEAIYRKE